ncbi:MAG: biotin--[acetyl-CoA-carboxylase] ligase [Paracoccaceae bacterium]
MADWPAQVQRHIFAELDSTNAQARRHLEQGAPPADAWFMAHSQTAARGRRGRHWHAPAGNFMASLLLGLDVPAAAAAQRSFVAALAVHDTLVALTGRGDIFTLKWPNDVLARGQKVAGILLETAGSGARVDHLIIGIGVNLAHAPTPEAVEPGAIPPISLQQASGITASPEVFLNCLAPNYAIREAQLRESGFAAIRHDWLDRAANLGATITAKLGDRIETGIFETLDETGALLLRSATGTQTIAAADIYF